MTSFLTQHGPQFEEYELRSESDYEELLDPFVGALLPGFELKPIKPLLASALGGFKPDSIGIKRASDGSFEQWALIEVELHNHPLLDHISSQLQRFNALELSDANSELISASFLTKSDVDYHRLEFFLKRTKPVTYLIIDRQTERLNSLLAQLSFDVFLIEARPFRNLAGERGILVTNNYTATESAIVSLGSLRPFGGILRFRLLHGALPPAAKITVRFGDGIIEAQIAQLRPGHLELHVNYDEVCNTVPRLLYHVNRLLTLTMPNDGFSVYDLSLASIREKSK